MKSLFTVLLGYFGFITVLGGLILLIVAMDKGLADETPFFMAFMAGTIAIGIYLINTKFWKRKITEISKIEADCYLLKKQIEKKELEIRIKEFES
jgi:amino acid permease